LSLTYKISLALYILPEISDTLEAVDDFEVPVEITFSKKTLDPVETGNRKMTLTEGRTRAFRQLRSNFISDHELNITKYNGDMVDNYCCFWVYQAHPAIPQTWNQISEYPFDFNFNGQFVANKRHNQSENPS
ncbi:hypothetical protein KR038_009294, partial [Drosophila bunnanda]